MEKIVNKISEFYKKVISIIKIHKIWSIIVAVVIITITIFIISKLSTEGTTVQYTYGKVTKGNLVVAVSGTGQVSTYSTVSIKPNVTGTSQTLGQITSVKVKNGDFVTKGDVIAILDGKNALQTYNQTKASLISAQANYDKVVSGLTESELISLNNSIKSAQTSLDNSKQNIILSLKSAYTSISSLFYSSTDSYFTKPMSTNPLINIDSIIFTSQQLQNNVNQGRYNIGFILDTWREKVRTQGVLVAASTSDEYIIESINSVLSDLITIRNYFDDMTTLFTLYGTASDSTGQSSLNSAKSTASGARSSTDSLISSLTSSIQSYNNSVTSLAQAKDNLRLKQEPPEEADLTAAQSSLDTAKANFSTAQDAYAARIITASFDGQIGGLNAVVGQSVSSNDSLGTLITAEKVVNVTLNETDATNVKANDPVTITFDSLSDVTLSGYVNYIDPLGTVSSGVVSYSVQVVIDEQNSAVKSGMTATVEIVTDKHADTLIIPTTAIKTSGKIKYVLVKSTNTFSGTSTQDSKLSTITDTSNAMNPGTSSKRASVSSSSNTNSTSGSFTKVNVVTGLSSGTNTEILSGLTEGQEIVVSTKTVTTSTTKTSATSATTKNSMGGGMMDFGGGGPGAAGGFSR